jgi:hypothetical protein
VLPIRPLEERTKIPADLIFFETKKQVAGIFVWALKSSTSTNTKIASAKCHFLQPSGYSR